MNKKDILFRGLIKENPIFVFLLGMCPSLAVTATLETSIGMGLLVIFVLAMSNLVVSLLKNLIPNEIKIPAYIVIIATFVTIIGMLANAYAPELYASLGVFIPLIVVNCLILGRAESFASKNPPVESLLDGIGMGLGFTLGLAIIGIVRELLATGQIAYGVYLPFPSSGYIIDFNFIGKLFSSDFNINNYGIGVFALPAGAFITLGFLLAAKNNFNAKKGSE